MRLKILFISMSLMSRTIRSKKKTESRCLLVQDIDPELLPYKAFKEEENSML